MALGDFDAAAPGLMIFSILFLIGYAATALSREVEQGTLHRFRLARATGLGVLGGISAAHLVLASVAFALMLGAAHMMGFHNSGSYLDAYVVILLTAVAALGVGMAIAGLARRHEEASNLAMMAVLPLGFLNGAFFDVPGVAVGGIGLYDLLPTTHAIDALRAIMNEGQTLSAASAEVSALAALAGLYAMIGGGLFWARRMARASP